MPDFTEPFWLAQIAGAIGLAIIIYAFQSNDRKKILMRQIWSMFFFSAHFFLIGAPTGAAQNGLVAVRNLVFMQKEDRKWAAHPVWLYIFCGAAVALLSFSWEGWISLFPVAGVIMATYALWQEDPKSIRILLLISTAAWVPYAIAVKSYPGLVMQAIAVSTILYAMWKHDRTRVM